MQVFATFFIDISKSFLGKKWSLYPYPFVCDFSVPRRNNLDWLWVEFGMNTLDVANN